MWHDTKISKLLNIRYPIIQAPMAGGATTPELIAAVSNSGGLGSLGAAFLTAENIISSIDHIRKLTGKPFIANLFTPESYDIDPKKLQTIKSKLNPLYKELKLTFPELKKPIFPDFEEQIDALIQSNVPIVSFTFGIPDDATLKKLKQAGIILIGTATSLEEAQLIENHGFDALVAQGSDAGGHRGTFIQNSTQSLTGTMALIPQIAERLSIPVIAAGGIMNGQGIAAALCLGADAVQMGTAFLSCPESGIPACHKKKLLEAQSDTTVLTKAFTGRAARGLQNTFTDLFIEQDSELLDFPIQGAATKLIRQTATKQENTELMSLWAGQGVALSTGLPANKLMRNLIAFLDEQCH